MREDSPAQGEALALAARQALAKAESIAQSLHGRIVRVVETHEGGAADFQSRQYPSAKPYSEYMNSNSSANSSYTTPVEAGTLNVRSQVVLVVEVEI
jgi:uncharacterized protein YggE